MAWRSCPSIRLALSCLCLSLSLSACGSSGNSVGTDVAEAGDSHTNPSTSHSDSASEHRLRVDVLHPKKATQGRTITQPGSCESFEVVKLFSKVSGFLKNQHVDIGDHVKAGQLLLEIDAPEIQQGVMEAQATLKKAHAVTVQKQAAIVSAQGDEKAAEAELKEAQANLESAQAEVKLRQLQHDRIQALAKDKAIEQELVDEKTEELRVAQSKLEAGKTAVNTAKAHLAAAKSHVAEAQADLKAAQANEVADQASLKKAKQFEEYTQIKSPIDGVITVRNFYNGDFVRAANASGEMKELLRVARIDKMRVVVQIPDQDAPYVHKGSKVSYRVGTLEGKTFDGQVSRTALAQAYQSRTMRAEVDLENPNGVLHDGMYGVASIQLDGTADCVVIPSRCIIDDGSSQQFVYVVKDHKAHRRNIAVAYNDGVKARITKGLKPDDQVVAREVPGLSDQSPVKIIAPNQQEAPQKTSSGSSKKTKEGAAKED